jgi:sulfatase maturation enzyme AslB (radical SAM superfamily)
MFSILGRVHGRSRFGQLKVRLHAARLCYYIANASCCSGTSHPHGEDKQDRKRLMADGADVLSPKLRAQMATKPATPGVKFSDPDWTLKGERRARVPLVAIDTLWINTGTLCNITCVNCYIESSPSNDRLAYIARAETKAYLDEIRDRKLATRVIAFTGGEPFLNPDMLGMLDDALAAGFETLVLTNAMQPLQRPKIKAGLLALLAKYGSKLTLRVSLDHYTRTLHEAERGEKTWAKAIAGLTWLSDNGFQIAIAGRTCWQESDASSRAGYAALIAAQGWRVDATSDTQLTLLPEMDNTADVPEISTACWDILGKKPEQIMCATSRMVVKRKGAAAPTVLPCTLLPYDEQFDMGTRLIDAENADGGAFDKGAVKLNHVNCAKFCVLGGGSCS